MGHLKLFMADTCHALKPLLNDTNTTPYMQTEDSFSTTRKKHTTHTFKRVLNTCYSHIYYPLCLLPVRSTTSTLGVRWKIYNRWAWPYTWTVQSRIHAYEKPVFHAAATNTDKIKGKRKKEIDYLVSENLSSCEHRFTNSTQSFRIKRIISLTQLHWIEHAHSIAIISGFVRCILS